MNWSIMVTNYAIKGAPMLKNLTSRAEARRRDSASFTNPAETLHIGKRFMTNHHAPRICASHKKFLISLTTPILYNLLRRTILAFEYCLADSNHFFQGAIHV